MPVPVRALTAVVMAASTVAIFAAAPTPSPALLILNKTDATLAIVNPATNAIVATIPTGDGPHEVVASSDGKLAFVSNYGAGQPGRSISVIDLVAQKELRRVDTSPLTRPHGLAYLDGKLYFTSETSQVVARYDPAADKVEAQFPTGQNTTHMVLISPDGRRMFTSNIRGNTVSILERAAAGADWTIAASVPVGRGPEGLDVSPDGKQLWSAHSQDGGVSVIDTAKREVVATLDLKTSRSNRLKFTPNGKQVLISDLDTGQLLVIDVASRTETKRIALGKMIEGILMTPDGARAYVAENGDNSVAIIDLKTLTVSGRISPGAGPDGMAWVVRK